MAAPADDRWWSKDTVAVVTGGNKGIGFEIVRQLAQKGITTVLTSRDVKRGEDATKQLVEEGLPVVYHQLDVVSVESASKLAEWLKQELGGVDILINSAGISLEKFDAPTELSTALEAIIETNYFGARHVTDAIFPLLKPSMAGARIINVSSTAGSLRVVAKESAKHLLGDDVNNLSEEGLDCIVKDYLHDLRENKHSEWLNPGTLFPVYIISKVFLNAYTRVLARKVASRPDGEKIFVNSFCPGLTITDMNRRFLDNPLLKGMHRHEADVAAGNALWLALLPPHQLPSGAFLADRKQRDF